MQFHKAASRGGYQRAASQESLERDVGAQEPICPPKQLSLTAGKLLNEPGSDRVLIRPASRKQHML